MEFANNTVSAVLFSRNDNYSDDLKDRAIICFKYLIDSVDEIIYVDWGTEEGKKPLLDELPDEISKNPKIKQIVISEEKVRDILPDGGDMMCQVFPRNIGIRSATKDYILSTNIDIIVPPEKQLKEMLVSDNTMYVISRKDVNMGATCMLFNANASIVYDILSWHTNEKNSSADYEPENFFKMNAAKQLLEDSDLYSNHLKYSKIFNCGDYQIAHRKVWYDIKGFEEGMIKHWGIDSNVQVKVIKHGFKLEILKSPNVFHMHHGARSSHIAAKTTMNDMDYFMNKFGSSENSNNWGIF
jgi:hypothetical protein